MGKIKKEGVLLVISSPSGTGKTTICKKLLEYDKNMHLSVSVTTRKKRKNEVEGIDYYFKSKNYFNTYRYRGLPPTPISYPGEKAILAVLYPNKTDYLYFVSDGKGGHRFSKNFTEHKKNIKMWIKDLKNYGKN